MVASLSAAVYTCLFIKVIESGSNIYIICWCPMSFWHKFYRYAVYEFTFHFTLPYDIYQNIDVKTFLRFFYSCHFLNVLKTFFIYLKKTFIKILPITLRNIFETRKMKGIGNLLG